METRKTNILSIIGFGLSLASLVVNYVYALFGLAGLICSIIGLAQIKERGEKGKVFAIVGIILGAFAFVISFLDSLLTALSLY